MNVSSGFFSSPDTAIGGARRREQFRRPELQRGALFVDVAVPVIDAFDASDPMPKYALNDDLVDAQARHVGGRGAAKVVDRPTVDFAAEVSFRALPNTRQGFRRGGPHRPLSAV